jgi:hypothetical protein
MDIVEDCSLHALSFALYTQLAGEPTTNYFSTSSLTITCTILCLNITRSEATRPAPSQHHCILSECGKEGTQDVE